MPIDPARTNRGRADQQRDARSYQHLRQHVPANLDPCRASARLPSFRIAPGGSSRSPGADGEGIVGKEVIGPKIAAPMKKQIGSTRTAAGDRARGDH